MKKIKKFMAAALAAVMTLAMGSTAFAAQPGAGDTGTITISGLEDGISVSAYQIVKANYGSEGNFLGYEQLYTAGDFAVGSDGSYNEDALTEANLAALYAVASQYGAYKTVDADAAGTASFTDMEVGSYLFVVQGSESTIYGMVIGSVYYAAEDGSWTIGGGSVNVQGTNHWVKASTPTIEKTETGGSLGDYAHGGSADVGDELTYHIVVTDIPDYEGEYPVFNVVDHISGNLTITQEQFAALTVKIGDTTLVKDKDYTVTRTDDGFKVDFVVDGKYTLNEYAGSTNQILIEYRATVTAADKDADLEDHPNEADLDYATTSYVYQSDVEIDDIDHDYTFNAEIKKVDQNSEALAGATFALYTDDACTEAYTQNGSAITATSDASGYFEFTGLEEGTYYMKETEAPAGYALNTNVYKIVITASYNADGTIQTGYSIMVYDEEGNPVGNAVVSATSAEIMNTRVGSLPSTGGRGTLTFTLVGCAIVACAVVGVVVTRRRRAA